MPEKLLHRAQKRRAGFYGNFILVFLTVCRVPTQAPSHFEEEAVSRMSRIVQLIPQVLRSKLR